MFSWCFLSVSRYFSIVRNLSREPDFSAENRIFKNFSKSLKTCLAVVFWVFHGILALFDIWAENRIFQPRIGFSKKIKMPQSVFSWCFLSVSKYFSIVRHLGWEPDFWVENRIFKNFLKSLKTYLVGVLWVLQVILALFEICAEPHFWAENRIFKNFSKSLKICFVGVFWVFQCIFFSIVRHLSRESDFLAENQIFKKFLKSLKICLVGVFWVSHVFF